MFGFLLVVMIIDGLLLSAVVLMQAGQGGGLASLGGGTTSQVLGGRQATNLLTRMTWWTGGIFMGLALVLSLVSSSRGTAGASDVQKRLRQAPAQQQSAPTGSNAIPGLTPPPPGAAAPGSQPTGGAALPGITPAPPGATAPGTPAPKTTPPAGKKP